MKRLDSGVDIRDAFFDEVYDIAAKDQDVVFITADADAFSLEKYRNNFPQRFINVGVAEQNMVTVASGLALSGKKVFIYAVIPFITMRCYEQIKVNICSMNLPVTVVGSGAGLSFSNDGPTHQAMQDISLMRTLPEITILNPGDSQSAAACAYMAHRISTPVYIRLDKGRHTALYHADDNFSDGLKVLKAIRDVNIISTGVMSQRAIETADELKKHSCDVGVIDLFRIKPINEDLLLELIGQSKYLITMEENSIVGGIGTIASELLIDHQKNIRLKRIALEDRQYFDYGSREWLHKLYKIDTESMVKEILNCF